MVVDFVSRLAKCVYGFCWQNFPLLRDFVETGRIRDFVDLESGCFKDEVRSMSLPRVDPLPSCLSPQPQLALDKDPGLLVPNLIRARLGQSRGIGLAILGTDCLQRLVAAPEPLLANVHTLLKDQPNHRVALIDPDFADPTSADATPAWCCKQTATRSVWVRFISRFVNLRATNAFNQGWALLKVRVRTPRPLAVIAVRSSGVYCEYLLTEAVPAAMSLETWLTTADRHSSGAAFQVRSDIARQLAIQLQRLHRHGFDHRDLKPTNILLSGQSRKSTVWLIDLDGVWRWPLLPTVRRVQNLGRLWAGVARSQRVGATDALRFLMTYLPAEQRAQWKTLWKQVARRALKKQSQQRVAAIARPHLPTLNLPQIGAYGP